MGDEGWAALVIHPDDDVGVALRALDPGSARVRSGDDVIIAAIVEPIAFGHKFALRDIVAGGMVRKYGDPIGVAVSDIRAGTLVHIHNLRSNRGRTAG
jgi:hypothetical protein